MSNKTVENYIKQLNRRIAWLEMCQKDDEEERIAAGSKYPLNSASNLSSHKELVTLQAVVRDLTHFVKVFPFSYWDYE